MTPDGVRYLAAVDRRVARPFHYRWLLPTLCRTSKARWQAAAYVAAAGYGLLLVAYTGSWWALVLAAGCAGVIRFNVRNPVLVDLPAMAVALGAAVCAERGWWLPAIAVALVAGCVKESAPIFAALWAWNPILLVGLVPVAVRHLQHPGLDVLDVENAWVLAHPFRASWKYHRPLPAWAFVLPWGVCLVGVPGLGWTAWACLAVAYGQCLIATDTVRLYQWALPVLAAGTVDVVPTRWWPVLAAMHLVNPFRTDGV